MKKRLEVSGAIFVRDGRVFAARRGESVYPYVAHKYEFIGGKLEEGETPEAALVRELKEETGMEIAVLSPFMTAEHEYPDFCITLHTFLCEMRSDYALNEHEEARWLAAEELDPEEWAPADAPVVDALREMLSRKN